MAEAGAAVALGIVTALFIVALLYGLGRDREGR
jgi:hypothetical protein